MIINVEAYYTKYGPMVLRRCRQLLRDENMALDAMQEVFVQLLRRRETLKDEYPSTLLYTIATHISLNFIRSRKRTPETTADETVLQQIAVIDEEQEGLISRSLLDKIFTREPASSRVMAVLHYVDGLTLAETAKEVNLSVSGVRKRLRLIQEKVNCLKDEYYGE